MMSEAFTWTAAMKIFDASTQDTPLRRKRLRLRCRNAVLLYPAKNSGWNLEEGAVSADRALLSQISFNEGQSVAGNLPWSDFGACGKRKLRAEENAAKRRTFRKGI